MAKTAACRLYEAKTRRGTLLGGSGLAHATLALLVVPGLTLGGVASAQTILPPAPPPGGPVSGPPDGGIAPGPPIRLPAPTPAPAPAPAPVPAPTPAPAPAPAVPAVPTAAPTRGPAPPRPPRPDTDRPVPAPQVPAPATQVEEPAEVAPSTDTPEAPAAVPEPAVEAVPADDDALPSWWPYALAAVLALLLGGWWAFSRRRTKPTEAVEEPVAPPVAKLPAASKQVSVKKQKDDLTPLRRHPKLLHADIEPLSASTTLVNMRLRYVLVLSNPTDRDIKLAGLADTILAGSGAQEAVIRQWFAQAPLNADNDAIVPAKGELRIDRELAVPLGQLSAMHVRGRAVMIPVLLVSIGFQGSSGLGQIGRAFVIGKPGQADAKLGPLPLDQGMGGFGELAARDTGIAQEG